MMEEVNLGVRQAEVPEFKVLLEAPLAKPNSVNTFTPFDQNTICFAVDVSGSTEGVVLEEEKAAIEALAEDLPTTTRQRCSIVPWDDDPDRYQASGLEGLQQLASFGGTDPSVLLQNQAHSAILQRSNVWFLLTDGEMDSYAVSGFTREIETHGLHSKACVLVIYGYRPSSPIQCNISVGVSVFAISPDCVFLFHDIETHELMLLQAKGCFSLLIPDGKPLILTGETTWDDLPLLTYGSLFKVRIPPAQIVRKNEFILQNRQLVNLEDLANNRLGAEDTNMILNDGQTLSSILVTMTARGKADEVKTWISNQRVTAGSKREFPRTDIGSNALKTITKIVDQWEDSQAKALSGLQRKLRVAHEQNWQALLDSVTKADEEAQLRNKVLDSATSRLSRMDSEDDLHSPVNLSPVLSNERSAYRDPYFIEPSELSRPVYTPYSPRLTREKWSMRASKQKQKADLSATKAACDALKARISYLPSYSSDTTNVPSLYECQLCATDTRSMAIIFKKPPTDYGTPGFPPSQSRSEILFPLAMAGFRETDIVSECACCEPCAYHLTKLGRSPMDTSVTRAVPGMVDFKSREDKQAWLEAFGSALEERFEPRNLLAIALSVLTRALRQYSEDTSASAKALVFSLSTTCERLATECRISYASGRLGTLHDAMSFYLRQSHLDFHNELFSHPVESFTLLLRYVPAKSPGLYTSALFMRLVLYLVEGYIESKSTYSAQGWSAFLDTLTPSTTNARQAELTTMHKHLADVSLQDPTENCFASLNKRGLLEDDITPHCKLLGPIWTTIENECESALLVCLRRLSSERSSCVNARQSLQQWRKDVTFKGIFEEPWKVKGEVMRNENNQPMEMDWAADTGRGLVITS